MASPVPIFDDIDNLKQMGGARLAIAKPHSVSVPKGMDIELATQDYRIVLDFLLSYSGSPDTFNSYRREVDRFLIWLWAVRKIHLPDVKRADIESYLDFIKNPPSDWKGTERKRRFIDNQGIRVPNTEWRPFVTTVSKRSRRLGAVVDEHKWEQSQSALKATLAILRTFFEHLLNEEFISRNPVAQIKSRSKKNATNQRTVSVKRLTKHQIRFLFESLEDQQNKIPADQFHRLKFILTCLVSMYLRISEIASSGDRQPVHGDFFYRIHDHEGSQIKTWWFRVHGKGNKVRQIPVDDAMLNALRVYRQSLGLSPLPAIGEKLPLFLKARGRGGLSSSRHIRAMLQELFNDTEYRLRASGFDDEADTLMACTVHWLRHTGISEDVQHRPLPHVRDGAGHASIATTGIYVENDELEIHKTAQTSSLLKQLRG